MAEEDISEVEVVMLDKEEEETSGFQAEEEAGILEEEVEQRSGGRYFVWS